MGLTESFEELIKAGWMLKLLVLGIGLSIVSLFFIVSGIWQDRIEGILCGAPLLLIGVGILYASFKVWNRQEDHDNYSGSEIGHGWTKKPKLEDCPECDEKMEVYHDGSALCKECGYASQDRRA